MHLYPKGVSPVWFIIPNNYWLKLLFKLDSWIDFCTHNRYHMGIGLLGTDHLQVRGLGRIWNKSIISVQEQKRAQPKHWECHLGFPRNRCDQNVVLRYHNVISLIQKHINIENYRKPLCSELQMIILRNKSLKFDNSLWPYNTLSFPQFMVYENFLAFEKFPPTCK